MRRLLGFSVLGLMALALALACSKDKGKGPVPVNYVLYSGVYELTGDHVEFVAVIDIGTDSIIDSIQFGNERLGWISVSADGQYLATHPTGSPSVIWELAGRTRKGNLGAPGGIPVFLPDTDLVIVPTYDSTLVFSLTTLELVDVWPFECLWPEPIPNVPYVIGVGHYGDQTIDPPDRLLIYDYSRDLIVDSVFGADGELPNFNVHILSLSPDGNRVYAKGNRSGLGTSLVGYDLDDRRMLFENAVSGSLGKLRVSPDGRELWITDALCPRGFFAGFRGNILIYDALTGATLDTIFTYGFNPLSNRPLYVRHIRFHPDGSKVYISCGSCGMSYGGGPVLVIDVQSREITKLIFDDFLHTTGPIEISPVP